MKQFSFFTLLKSAEEFLPLMKIKHGTSNRLNHAVNLITGMVIQQEVTCSKQEVCRIIPGAGERKPKDETFKKTMLLKEQESGQKRILQENTLSLSDNIQDLCRNTKINCVKESDYLTDEIQNIMEKQMF